MCVAMPREWERGREQHTCSSRTRTKLQYTYTSTSTIAIVTHAVSKGGGGWPGREGAEKGGGGAAIDNGRRF